MLEISKSIFVDRKTGKRKTKRDIITSAVIFGVIVLFLATSFFMLCMMMGQSCFDANLGWMYFLVVGGIAILMGVFGCVFNTYSTLFLAKDNDMLLAMPIPVKYILISRLLGVYLMGVVYSGIVSIPMIIVCYIYGSPSFVSILSSLLLLILITLFVFVLSCLLGFLVAKISTRLKYKSIVIVLLSLLFVAAYYYVYFNAEQLIVGMLTNGVNIAEQMRVWAYPFFAFANVAMGDGWSILTSVSIVAVLLTLSLWLLNRNFLKIATNTSGSKNKKRSTTDSKRVSVRRALLGKELKRFGSSAVYMLNCGLGSFFMLVASVLLLIKSADIINISTVLAAEGYDILAVLGMAALMMMAAANDITAPSISLEGKNLWILKSLPISEWQILRAKIDLHITITMPCVLISSICTTIALGLGWLISILIIIVTVVFVYESAIFGLLLNLKVPLLVWNNETTPVKQSSAVILSIFVGWIYVIIMAAVYIPLRLIISPMWYIVISLLVNLVITLLLWRCLKTKGVAMFRNL